MSEPTDPLPSDAFLATLGRDVRAARAQRGVSRKALAAASGVSERYIAQLEAGKGNISVLLLRQVAAALNLAPDDLLDGGFGRPLEYTLLRERLRKADDAELVRLYETLIESRQRAARRADRVALIGLRGAGKSTLGAALAQRLGVPFVELAQEIEREAGMAIGRIFATGGQPAYRRFERQALGAALRRFSRAVIAPGGSLVAEAESYELLRSGCYTVWLRARPEEHMQRVMAQGDLRPMADNARAMDDLRRILAERDARYRRADAVVDTSGRSVADSLAVLLALPPLAEVQRDHEVLA